MTITETNRNEVIYMPGFEELIIRQGGMFFGLFILVVISFIFFNAILKKD